MSDLDLDALVPDPDHPQNAPDPQLWRGPGS